MKSEKVIKSPLRYPGGKTELGPYVEQVIRCNDLYDCHFIEPFAGGSSISIHLLQKGIVSKITLIEFDPLIYSFWLSIFQYTDELCAMIAETPITLDTWNKLQQNRNQEIPISTKILELGFSGLFFNRTNFSGILKAGPIGGKEQSSAYKIDCRFNKERIIETIRFLSIFRDRVEVKWTNSLKYLKSMEKNTFQEKTFLYLDPPYYKKGKSLYRKFFTDNDHLELSKRLRALQHPWLLSYDDCPFISYLYANSDSSLKRQTLFFDYSAGVSKKEKELLISNLEIPPIENVKKNPFVI